MEGEKQRIHAASEQREPKPVNERPKRGTARTKFLAERGAAKAKVEGFERSYVELREHAASILKFFLNLSVTWCLAFVRYRLPLVRWQ